MLAQTRIEMRQVAQALECGREAEGRVALMTSAGAFNAKVSQMGTAMMPTLYAMLANTFEGLGRMDDCLRYDAFAHRAARRARGIGDGTVAVYERQARHLLGQGKAVEVEQLLAPVVLSGYQYQVEAPGGLGGATAGFQA